MACNMVNFGMEIMFTSGMGNVLEFTAKVQEGDHYVEQEKDTNLLFREETEDRDAALQRFADLLSEIIAKHICELDIDSLSLPDEK